jgi:hypothetical protein
LYSTGGIQNLPDDKRKQGISRKNKMKILLAAKIKCTFLSGTLILPKVRLNRLKDQGEP